MKIEDQMTESLIVWLERPERDNESVREVAEGIVDALFGYLRDQMKEPAPTLKVGQPFKSLITGKIHTPLWEEDGLWWIVTSDSRYGYLGPSAWFQKYAVATKGAPAKTVNSKGWEIGDKATFLRQRAEYAVLAVSENGVLMNLGGGSAPQVEPNDMLAKYYKKTARLF